MIGSTASQEITNMLSSIRAKLSDDDFAQEAVEIISREIQVDLAAIWLFTDNMQSTFLHAGSGDIGKRLASKRHKIPLVTSRNLFASVAKEEVRVINGWSGDIYGCKLPETIRFDSSLPIHLIKKNEVMHSQNVSPYTNFDVPNPRWEAAFPLRVETRVYGAFYIQILEASNFTIEYCSNLQWLTDKLSSIYMQQNYPALDVDL